MPQAEPNQLPVLFVFHSKENSGHFFFHFYLFEYGLSSSSKTNLDCSAEQYEFRNNNKHVFSWKYECCCDFWNEKLSVSTFSKDFTQKRRKYGLLWIDMEFMLWHKDKSISIYKLLSFLICYFVLFFRWSIGLHHDGIYLFSAYSRFRCPSKRANKQRINTFSA